MCVRWYLLKLFEFEKECEMIVFFPEQRSTVVWKNEIDFFVNVNIIDDRMRC
jgi:hypothetical protein